MSLFLVEAPKSGWEVASWIAQVIIALATVSGALFAGKQLVDVRRSSRAALLLQLDERFDSQELRDARTLFADMHGDIQQIVSGQNLNANDQKKRELVCQEWTKTLNNLLSQDHSGYLRLLGYLGFFETIGVMVKKKYIAEHDVMDLYRGPLVDIGGAFSTHIAERSKEMGVTNGMFEHALNLSSRASDEPA